MDYISERVLLFTITGVIGFLGWVIRHQWLKVDTLKERITKNELEITRQRQENSELYNNIKRIDTNIDRLFDKVDKLLDIMRSEK